MTQMEAPRRGLLGKLRFRMMVTRCVIAWWPIPVAVVAAVLLPTLSLIGLALVVVAVEWKRPGVILGRLRAAWWRTMWWFDARAAGLCVVADPGMNATHEAGRPRGVELAPALLRVRCCRTARLYVLRSLPGQTFRDFEKATDSLAHRWGAQVAVSEHPRRRACVLIEVVSARALAEPLSYPKR